MQVEQPGLTTFLELADTPNLYAGESEKILSVKITEDGLEFVEAGVDGIWNEENPASGVVNGTNKVYTYTHVPGFISLEGQALSILNGDYSVTGANEITLTNAPVVNPPINKYLT